MSDLPGIALEEMYGEDFEHAILDKLVRVAKSYLELATDPEASVAQRARDIAAAVELLEIAGVEVLQRGAPPFSEAWTLGSVEGRSAAAMVLRSLDRPGFDPEPSTFEFSLHSPDGTEIQGAGYKRQPATMAPIGGLQKWALAEPIQFWGLPGCTVSKVGVWSRGRKIHEWTVTKVNIVPGDGMRLDKGECSLGV